MFDIGWTELLLIGIVALIVVGPKDLPRMFAALGRFTAKARSMAREFQRAMDEAAKESGVAETAKDLRTMTSKKSLGLDKIEEAARKFESWDPTKTEKPKPSAAAAAKPGSETAKLAETRAAEAAARREAAAKPAGGASPAKSEAKAAKAGKSDPAPAKAPAKRPAAAKPAGTAKAKPAAKQAARKPKAKADDA